MAKANAKLYDDRDSISTAQLAERWGLDVKYLQNHRATKCPPCFRPTGGKRGQVRYRLEDVRAWERKHRVRA